MDQFYDKDFLNIKLQIFLMKYEAQYIFHFANLNFYSFLNFFHKQLNTERNTHH